MHARLQSLPFYCDFGKTNSLQRKVETKTSSVDDPKDATKLRKLIRWTGNELIEFRWILKTELKNGVPVVKIEKTRVSASYLYQLRALLCLLLSRFQLDEI